MPPKKGNCFSSVSIILPFLDFTNFTKQFTKQVRTKKMAYYYN